MLLVAPWSTFWERNLFVETPLMLGGVMRLAAVRGAVSGVGVVNLFAGIWQLGTSLVAIARPPAVPAPLSPELRGEGPALRRDPS